VSFATLFLANPDLPERLRRAGPFNTPDRPTFYGGGERGYTDYPLLFDGISIVIRGMVGGLTALLRVLPAPALIVAIAALAYALRRSWTLTAFVALALLFILNQGYWVATLETLSLVMVATLVSAAVGVPLGIAAAHRPRLFAALRPVLDLMQTLPTFVYLIPTLVLFGLGVVPGLISTVIFALPAPIRLTHLGISSVPRPLIEAGEAFGATPMQLLWKIELPSAATTIVAGITAVHHAESLHGRDRGLGGCRRTGCAGGTGIGFGASRNGV